MEKDIIPETPAKAIRELLDNTMYKWVCGEGLYESVNKEDVVNTLNRFYQAIVRFLPQSLLTDEEKDLIEVQNGRIPISIQNRRKQAE